MSRSGYQDDCGGWELIMWRGAVSSAIRGKRGQKFMLELLAALDSLPEKRLIAHELRDEDGAVCALGAIAASRRLDVARIDVDDRDAVAATFGIAPALAAEIAFINDDDFGYQNQTPEKRFTSVREWVVEQIVAPAQAKETGNAPS